MRHDDSLHPISGRKRHRGLLEEENDDDFDDDSDEFPLLQWIELIDRGWREDRLHADVEIVIQWLIHPRIRNFIDWKDDDMGYSYPMLHSALLRDREDIAK